MSATTNTAGTEEDEEEEESLGDGDTATDSWEGGWHGMWSLL